MKIKEVCVQTGLTERAVRFYVQEKLVVPLAQRRGGRTWLDFSPADVDRLKAISTLRKAGFTLEEIRSMTHDFRKNAPEAAFALRQRLRESILETLCMILCVLGAWRLYAFPVGHPVRRLRPAGLCRLEPSDGDPALLDRKSVV